MTYILGRLPWHTFLFICIDLCSRTFEFAVSNSSLENDINVYTKSREELKYCGTSENEKHACWIGPGMLSRQGAFYKLLEEKSNDDKLIILAYVDFSYIEMAINLYQYSLKRLNITNFVFVCSEMDAVHALKRKGIDSFLYTHDVDSSEPSDFGTEEFKEKISIKQKIITAAVMLGFKTLLTDIDIVFLRDPIPYLRNDADVVIQDDLHPSHPLNSGFYLVCPTYAGVELQQRTLEYVMSRPTLDQPALNTVIKEMVEAKTLKVFKLNSRQFACGKEYFEYGKRMFLGDFDDRDNNVTYIVHNNWIYTKDAKIHRFKETGLWSIDKERYYSSKSRKYIMYSNPIDFGQTTEYRNTELIEASSLITAMTLGKILNRTLIFPKFHCYGCKNKACQRATDHCSFNALYHVQTFNRNFSDTYREHFFLRHPKVPKVIKNSVSPVIQIVKSSTKENIDLLDANKTIIATKDATNILATDILSWFDQGPLSKFHVLHFHSLYFNIKYNKPSWWDIFKHALKFCNYRQDHRWVKEIP